MSPKLPRDVSCSDLLRALERLGYVVVRQEGSHIRLRTSKRGEQHLTVPNHDPVKVGTLNAILEEVADHFKMTKSQLLARLRL